MQTRDIQAALKALQKSIQQRSLVKSSRLTLAAIDAYIGNDAKVFLQPDGGGWYDWTKSLQNIDDAQSNGKISEEQKDEYKDKVRNFANNIRAAITPYNPRLSTLALAQRNEAHMALIGVYQGGINDFQAYVDAAGDLDGVPDISLSDKGCDADDIFGPASSTSEESRKKRQSQALFPRLHSARDTVHTLVKGQKLRKVGSRHSRMQILSHV